MKEKEEDAEEFEKQIQQLRKRNTKLQREVKDAQENLQQSKKLNKVSQLAGMTPLVTLWLPLRRMCSVIAMAILAIKPVN